MLVLGKNITQPEKPNQIVLDRILNPHANVYYNIRLSVPEFTSICPVTGQPDFAFIVIDYIPKKWIVESKSFKLYINSFRNEGIFHEDVTISIASFLKQRLRPKWIRIGSFFAPRGGIPIDVSWQSDIPPKGIYIPSLSNSHSKFINR